MGNSIKFIEPHTMIRFGELAQQACPKVLREDSLAKLLTQFIVEKLADRSQLERTMNNWTK